MMEWFSQQQVGSIGGIGFAALGILGACIGVASIATGLMLIGTFGFLFPVVRAKLQAEELRRG